MKESEGFTNGEKTIENVGVGGQNMKLINTVLSSRIGNESYHHLSTTGTCFWLRLLLTFFSLYFFLMGDNTTLLLHHVSCGFVRRCRGGDRYS